MIFTFYYTYATFLQWWRLKKLKSTLETNLWTKSDGQPTAILVNKNNPAANYIEIISKQKLNLDQCLTFPPTKHFFPIPIETNNALNDNENIFLLLQATFDRNLKQQRNCDLIQIEQFGQLIAWKCIDDFEIVLKTNLDLLVLLLQRFKQMQNLDINRKELKLVRIQTIAVEGAPINVKYEKKYSFKQQFPSPNVSRKVALVECKNLITEIKELYGKLKETITPKIKIENGSIDSLKLIAPTKPKELKKVSSSSKEVKKTTLDAGHHHHHRRHTSKTEPEPKKPKEVKIPPSTKIDKKKTPNKSEETKPAEATTSKPPTVLVYADSTTTKDKVKEILSTLLDTEKYTVYDLTNAKSAICTSSTALVVVCGTISPPDLTSNLIQYYLSGGRLLCLCSDLMYAILHSFTTAEVREHELVQFNYKQWRNVKMLHHVFCYQPSPAKKQFSKDGSNSSENGGEKSPSNTPTVVEFRHNDKEWQIQVKVLGTEETWQTPSLLLATNKHKGCAIFSQVHLEIDPMEYEQDELKFKSLKNSNEARIAIFKDLLMNYFDLECKNSEEQCENPNFGQGYFLGRYDEKMNLLTESKNIENNVLNCNKEVSLKFCLKNEDVANLIPVQIHACPTNFSTFDYFDTLKTNYVGRLVIYLDLITSSQHLLAKKLKNGLAVIARQQTKGVGRANNQWISPMGSANFSLQLHIPLSTHLGRYLPLVQHLACVAIVKAIKDNVSSKINLGIKWPNDLYLDGKVKIGGIIVNSLIESGEAIVNIGCGLNLSNAHPTTCLNDVLKGENVELVYEKYFAFVFNEVELLMGEIEKSGDFECLFQLYYKYWLHQDSKITIQNDKGEEKEAKIVGLDEYGFLSVALNDGTRTSVQPDGNSFDMMRGLIAPKSF